MKYPRVNPLYDRRRKLTPSQISSIRLLYKRHWKPDTLAKRYKVSISTILYWTNKEYRRKNILSASLSARNRYKLDKTKHRKITNLSHLYLRLINPQMNKYVKLKARNTYHQNRLKLAIYNNEHRQKTSY